MDRLEFAKVMAYLSLACGKPLSADAAEVYFDLLGDLDPETLRTAAKRVSLEHPWATFPSIAELRQAASETLRGVVKEISPSEAWDMAWSAVKDIDLEIPHTMAMATKHLPPSVLEAMRTFGVPSLIYGKEPVAVVRAQFMKIFEEVAAREKRTALLPAAVKTSIERIGDQTEGVKQIAGLIGELPK